MPALVAAGLIEVTVPEKTEGFGRKTPQFRTQKRADYSLRDELDRKLGEAGELAVLQKEKRRLSQAGRSDLADKILHVSQMKAMVPDMTSRMVSTCRLLLFSLLGLAKISGRRQE